MHHLYLVCILFGMPSLHLFTFLMFFKSCIYIYQGVTHFNGVINDPKAVYPGSFYTFAIFLVMLKNQLETVGKQLR